MKKKQKRRAILTIIAVLAILGCVVVLLTFLADNLAKDTEQDNDVNSELDSKEMKSSGLDAGYSIKVTEIGSYTGTYMEDASDQEVAEVMMIKVKNVGKEPIQYAEVTIFSEGKEAGHFKLSTLLPEETMMILEADKQLYNKEAEYSQAVASNVAIFQNEPQMYTDKLEIQPLDGGFNITNISDENIEGEIVIYFKDCEGDMLTGGITYRGRVEDGLKKGEIRQIMSSKFTENHTKIMFITIDGK